MVFHTGHTKTRRDSQITNRQRPDRQTNTFRSQFRFIDVCIGHENRKLFATVATDNVVLGNSFHDDSGNLPQHVIARRVTMVVINFLEMIDIDHDR